MTRHKADREAAAAPPPVRTYTNKKDELKSIKEKLENEGKAALTTHKGILVEKDIKNAINKRLTEVSTLLDSIISLESHLKMFDNLKISDVWNGQQIYTFSKTLGEYNSVEGMKLTLKPNNVVPLHGTYNKVLNNREEIKKLRSKAHGLNMSLMGVPHGYDISIEKEVRELLNRASELQSEVLGILSSDGVTDDERLAYVKLDFEEIHKDVENKIDEIRQVLDNKVLSFNSKYIFENFPNKLERAKRKKQYEEEKLQNFNLRQQMYFHGR